MTSISVILPIAIVMVSAQNNRLRGALIAHFAVGDGPEAWGFAAGTGVLWGLSYFLWRRLKAMSARA